MDSRVLDRIRFILERWLQGGARNQLLFVAALIVLISVIGGLLAALVSDDVGGPLNAIWWSFLRLSDPGYLGDDEGFALRVISTAVTVLGYVLFLGSLIAIMTQWLNQTIRRLESGLTPITISNHILILGWTNRTPHLIREIIGGQASPEGGGARSRPPRVVILAEDVGPELRHEIRETLGDDYNRWRIILRSGTPLKIEHLKRVDFAHAAVIILPGADFAQGGHEASDAHVIKAVMTIARYLPDEPGTQVPDVIAEILDSDKAAIVDRAYPGRIEVVAGDAFISRLIAQNVRHRGLSHLYAELFTYARGNEFYVRSYPELAGSTFASVGAGFPEAIVLGIVRIEGGQRRTLLNPPPGTILGPDDRLVAIAHSFSRFRPADQPVAFEEPERLVVPPARSVERRRVLLIGWNHRVPALLAELGHYRGEQFHVDVLASGHDANRIGRMKPVPPAGPVHLRHIEGEVTDHAVIARLDPGSYDTIVVLSDDDLASGEESDARTILGAMTLQGLMPGPDEGPSVIVELMDPANALLVSQHSHEVIITPVLLSHLLAHIALRRELGSVLAELFGPDGPEIFFRPISDYGLTGREARFRDIRLEAARHGEIAVGIQAYASPTSTGGVYLNPPPDRYWQLSNRDRIVVLTTS